MRTVYRAPEPLVKIPIGRVDSDTMRLTNTQKAARLLGSISTPKKARAARRNGKLGGWPKGRKRKRTPPTHSA